MDVLETATNVAVALEVVAALVLAFLNRREVRYLDELEPAALADAAVAGPLPLYHSLSFRAKYVTAVVLYLLVLTALGALGIVLSELFPPIRAINGLLLLGVLAEPLQTGRAIRKGEEESSSP